MNYPLSRTFCDPDLQSQPWALPIALTAMASANSFWMNSFILLRLSLDWSPSSFACLQKVLMMMETLSKKRDIFLQIHEACKKSSGPKDGSLACLWEWELGEESLGPANEMLGAVSSVSTPLPRWAWLHQSAGKIFKCLGVLVGWGVSSSLSADVFEWCLIWDGRMPVFVGRREGTGDGDSRDTPRTSLRGLYPGIQSPGSMLLSLLGTKTQQLLWSTSEDV